MDATAEVITVRPYCIEPDVFLDALNECPPTARKHIAEAAAYADLVYSNGVVHWLCTKKPPLPVLGIASYDPRTRDASVCERLITATK
jgi:hypothetical protein